MSLLSHGSVLSCCPNHPGAKHATRLAFRAKLDEEKVGGGEIGGLNAVQRDLVDSAVQMHDRVAICVIADVRLQLGEVGVAVAAVDLDDVLVDPEVANRVLPRCPMQTGTGPHLC